MLLYEAARRTQVPVCSPANTIREAAKAMTQAGTAAVCVSDGDGNVVGVLTAGAILEAIGKDTSSGERVDAIMDASPCFLPPEATVSQCVLAMGPASAAVITKGGEPHGQLHGMISASDLAPAFGEQPSYMLHEIPLAPSAGVLRRLQQRARNFVLEQLTSPEAVEWLAKYVHQADTGILKRLARLAPAPHERFCWCLYGAAGRLESLPPGIQRSMVIVADGRDRDPLLDWYRRMHELLLECGYIPRASHFDPEYSVAALAEWKQRFRGLITAPIQNPIHHSRPLFDLCPVMGQESLFDELAACVGELVRANPAFVRLLAHDCFANLPPLAFFRDAVVEESGERSETLDLKRSALRPLADVGRVFGIAAGRALGGSTLERFRMARTLAPEQEAIFREAAQTLAVALYEHGRAGIRQQDGGWKLNPARLSHHDRQVLKSGFRSIHNLLEFTADGNWMGAS
jgi:CBS domain-containing protein